MSEAPEPKAEAGPGNITDEEEAHLVSALAGEGIVDVDVNVTGDSESGAGST